MNRAKEILAFEVTKLIHGEEEAQKAQDAARALFSAGSDSANMPSATLSAADFENGEIAVLDLLLKTGLVPSKGEGRRLIDQGGVVIDDQKVAGATAKLSLSAFDKGQIIVKKGKKVFLKVTVE